MELEKMVVYLQLALRVQMISFSMEHIERIIRTYEMVLEKKGGLSLEEIWGLDAEMVEKYKEISNENPNN